MVGLGLAMLLSALDQSIVATALPTIGAELGDFERLPWIVTAYLVAATVVTPLYGKLADIHGARVMLLAGVSIFIAGSIACALAPSVIVLVAARALQGSGGGGLIALAQTVVADLVSPRERGRYQTYFAAVFVTSSVAGPLLGGFFSQHLRWTLIFWINLPLGLAAIQATNARLKRLPQRRHPHRVDIPGAALLVLASGLLVLGLGWGGTRFAWGSAPVLATLAASALFWALFLWRARRAREPLIPLSVLGDPVVRDATLSSACGLGAFVGLTAVMPIYFQSALGLSADRSGVALMPLMLATVAGATFSGRAMARLKRYKRPSLALLVAGLAAALAAAWRLEDLSLWGLDLLLSLSMLGVGAMLPVATICVQNAAHARDLGTATAVMQFFRQLGCAVVVALLGALVVGGAALAPSFRLVLLTVAICVALSLAFLLKMEERPLSGSGAA